MTPQPGNIGLRFEAKFEDGTYAPGTKVAVIHSWSGIIPTCEKLVEHEWLIPNGGGWLELPALTVGEYNVYFKEPEDSAFYHYGVVFPNVEGYTRCQGKPPNTVVPNMFSIVCPNVYPGWVIEYMMVATIKRLEIQ